MAHLEIDNNVYDVKDDQNLLSACLSLGLDLPYFCWHPALGSAGACRQCAIIQYKDADDKKGRLVMACMTPVADNLRISITDIQAHQFRSDNIELLMTNHPHDCPVCEEGGECHLQDMTVMTGHTGRRYRGKKRTHNNQNLGPFINHEMNRCIACYRCVRFYDDYAGGKDLQVFGIHNNVYFGRFEDGALENEFSGNLVEVCPTGVFTDKTFSAHYARKWDLQTAPSICVNCGLGCNIAPGERYGELRRVINRYNGDVNGYFLCDRGRFGYGFVNSAKRIRAPRSNDQTIATVETAKNHFHNLLKTAKNTIGIGSPRASLEANFALRSLVGEENYFLGLDNTEHALLNAIIKIMRDGGIHSPSMREVEQADAVLILGEDVTHSAPRLALSLRQTVRKASFDLANTMHIPLWQDAAIRQLGNQVRSPLFIASICATRLDDVATNIYRGDPENIARLGFAIAHCLDDSAPAPSLSPAEQALAIIIANNLKQAKRPLIVSGTSCSSLAVIQAAYNVVKALPSKDKQLTFTVPECNSVGLAIMGGKTLQLAFERISHGSADSVIILENDLYRRAPKQTVDLFFETAVHVVVIDSLQNTTTEKAELLLPAATFAESEGTLVNNEGRAQRYFPIFPATEQILGSWQWLTSAMEQNQWGHHDTLTAACASAFPDLSAISQTASGANYTIDGCKIPRQSHRYSGRTAMHANVKVSEPGPSLDRETVFAFSMEGETAQVQPALLPVIWAPGWNSNQAINKFQEEINGHLRGRDFGIRLLEASGTLPWFTDIPPAFKQAPGLWQIISLPHIFGSEELSLQSPPLAERLPNFCVLLNPLDAGTLKVGSGDQIEMIDLAGTSILKTPVKVELTLPQGLIGITTGRPEFQSMKFFSQVTLKKVTQESQP